MGYEAEMATATVVAGADLDTMQYKVVGLAGTIAASSSAAGGILLNKPKSGEHATVGYHGRLKGYAGAAISLGAALMVTTSGFLITCTSGNGVVGKALEAANSGDIFAGIFNFASGRTAP